MLNKLTHNDLLSSSLRTQLDHFSDKDPFQTIVCSMASLLLEMYRDIKDISSERKTPQRRDSDKTDTNSDRSDVSPAVPVDGCLALPVFSPPGTKTPTNSNNFNDKNTANDHATPTNHPPVIPKINRIRASLINKTREQEKKDESHDSEEENKIRILQSCKQITDMFTSVGSDESDTSLSEAKLSTGYLSANMISADSEDTDNKPPPVLNRSTSFKRQKSFRKKKATPRAENRAKLVADNKAHRVGAITAVTAVVSNKDTNHQPTLNQARAKVASEPRLSVVNSQKIMRSSSFASFSRMLSSDESSNCSDIQRRIPKKKKSGYMSPPELVYSSMSEMSDTSSGEMMEDSIISPKLEEIILGPRINARTFKVVWKDRNQYIASVELPQVPARPVSPNMKIRRKIRRGFSQDRVTAPTLDLVNKAGPSSARASPMVPPPPVVHLLDVEKPKTRRKSMEERKEKTRRISTDESNKSPRDRMLSSALKGVLAFAQIPSNSKYHYHVLNVTEMHVVVLEGRKQFKYSVVDYLNTCNGLKIWSWACFFCFILLTV